MKILSMKIAYSKINNFNSKKLNDLFERLRNNINIDVTIKKNYI